MIKTTGADGTSAVTFTLDPRVGARVAVVCGEWNGWSRDVHVMERDEHGGFRLTIALEPGRRYRFRYLLDGERWENDWAADAYERNAFGEDDSIVNLTAAGVGSIGGPGAPPRKAPARKAPAKPAAPRKAAATKAAATNAAATKTASKKAPTAEPVPPAAAEAELPPATEPLSKKAARKAAKKALE